MVNAVVSGGEIRPLEPLPAEWHDGQRLRVEKADDAEPSVEEIDRDFAVLASLCEASDPADEEQLERALQAARRSAGGRGRAIRFPRGRSPSGSKCIYKPPSFPPRVNESD